MHLIFPVSWSKDWDPPYSISWKSWSSSSALLISRISKSAVCVSDTNKTLRFLVTSSRLLQGGLGVAVGFTVTVGPGADCSRDVIVSGIIITATSSTVAIAMLRKRIRMHEGRFAVRGCSVGAWTCSAG